MNSEKTYFCYLTPARHNMHETVTEAEGEIFAAHCEFLVEEFEKGRVFQAGTSFEKNSEHFALVIFSATDKGSAEAFIRQDPAVAKGLLIARTTEYGIFLDRGQP